jgi:ABC-type transporter Mla subunit MlaD
MDIIEVLARLAENNLAGFIALAWLIYMWFQDRHDAREEQRGKRDDDAVKHALTAFAAFAGFFEGLTEKLTGAEAKMAEVSQRRDEQLEDLSHKIDQLPGAVREKLLDDFERIGSKLSDLLTDTRDTNQRVKDLMAEWVKLAGVIRRVQGPSDGTSTTDAPAGADATDASDYAAASPEPGEGAGTAGTREE